LNKSTAQLIKETKQRKLLWKIWFVCCAFVAFSSYLGIIINDKESTLFITCLSVWTLSIIPIYQYEKSKNLELIFVMGNNKLKSDNNNKQPRKKGKKWDGKSRLSKASFTLKGKTYKSKDFKPEIKDEDFDYYSRNLEVIPQWFLPSISYSLVSCKNCFRRVSAAELPKHVNSTECKGVQEMRLYATSELPAEKIKCEHCSRIVLKKNLSKHLESKTCKGIQERRNMSDEEKRKRAAEKKKTQKEKDRRWQEMQNEIARKERESKEKAFSRKNFQAGHGSISMQKKDKIWTESRGRCNECSPPYSWHNTRKYTTKPLSFWWTIHPELKVLLLCDKCAKKLDLVEENSSKNDSRSRRIKSEVKQEVWRRDGGCCVNCGSDEDLEYDHIIPHSRGGANTSRNIQLLCEICNRKKSDNIE